MKCRIANCTRTADSQSFTDRLCLHHYNDRSGVLPQTPTVCVCDYPLDVSPIGECQRCFRPFKQSVFDRNRAAWRAYLGLGTDPQLLENKIPPP